MKKILLTAIYLFFSTQTQAWTLDADFENGIIGNKAGGDSGFTGPFKSTLYTDLVTHTGKLAAELKITEDSTGWAEFGGAFNYPKALFNGDEIWFRIWAYFPTGFSFDCGGCTQGVKFIRIGTESDNGGEGFHSILLKGDSVEVDSEVTGKTFHSNNAGKKTVGERNTTGRWHAYEMHIKFSSEPGKGIYRVWQNGNLVFEDTQTKTLQTSTSKSSFIYLFTYWNSGAPKTQKLYVDDIVVTNIRPSDTDTHGNPFIGLGGYNLVAPPLPPSLN